MHRGGLQLPSRRDPGLRGGGPHGQDRAATAHRDARDAATDAGRERVHVLLEHGDEHVDPEERAEEACGAGALCNRVLDPHLIRGRADDKADDALGRPVEVDGGGGRQAARPLRNDALQPNVPAHDVEA